VIFLDMNSEMLAADADGPIRTGYVTLLGRPNAGKSTLMNQLLGQKLSIVTPKAQTTWQRVTGIHTTDRIQAIFLDTPGLLIAKDLFQQSMLEEALEAVREGDVIVLLVDATDPLREAEREAIREALSLSDSRLIVVINKIDSANPGEIARIAEWARSEFDVDARGVSALNGDGVEALWSEIEAVLPEGPFLYPPDDIAAAPVRFFVAEFIREAIFEQFWDEVPYSVFPVIDEFREDQEPVYIKTDLYVERNSQKGILVGERGTAIRELGRSSRKKIEAFIGQRVYLELRVKLRPKWRRRGKDLGRFGFRVPVGQAPND
jgi:GTP-binding protein Era